MALINTTEPTDNTESMDNTEPTYNVKLMTAVKLSLGISHSKLDSEITACIQAAKAELLVSGAEAGPISFDHGALYEAAIKLYARSWFNYQGQSERWRAAFDKLRDSIALCDIYRGGRTYDDAFFDDK